MKKGKIIKSQKDLYYVYSQGNTYQCKARGNFRVKNKKPLVGDIVIIDQYDDDLAYIIDIEDRYNEIKRPNIANVEQILLFATINDPPLNLYNLDKYLAMIEFVGIEVCIILSKKDLAEENKLEEFIKTYKKAGYKVISINNYDEFPKDEIKNILKNKTSALSGASGVGKSTFLNNLVNLDIKIGEISQKLKRGKNTTRHTEIFKIDEDSFLFDTPGFDSFDFDFLDDESNLKYTFKEFKVNECKFNDCNHIKEPGCKVKEDLKNNNIAKSRYENYIQLFNELKKRRENKW